MASASQPGKLDPSTLYIVATPIGNLGDMTYRAVETLQAVDWIAAEDTRNTGKLLQAYSIKTPQLSYHDHNRSRRGPELIAKLQQGAAIALVSDAGMPCISDPGYELVRSCWEAGLRVVPIPGVSAVTTALSAAGLSPQRFVFEGFLPAKSKARKDSLSLLQDEPRTLVFYESPHRIKDTLADLAVTLGAERKIALARELTKLHEEFWRGTIAEAIAHYQQRVPKGEFTVLVAGAEPRSQTWTSTELRQELQQLINQGLSRSAASRELAQRTGQPKRELYQLSLDLRNPAED